MSAAAAAPEASKWRQQKEEKLLPIILCGGQRSGAILRVLIATPGQHGEIHEEEVVRVRGMTSFRSQERP